MAVVALSSSIGCLPDPAFPLEPTLTFQSLATSEDGTTPHSGLHRWRRECGVDPSRHLAPICQTCEHHYNLVGRYEEWVDSAWRSPTLLVPYAYRVPVAEPTGSSPALDGTIEVELTSWYLTGTGADSVRFEWTLWDRDLNPSNGASTGSVAVPD